MQQLEPADGEYLHLERKGQDEFIVEPLALPAYEGDVGGALPIVAAREIDALKKRFPRPRAGRGGQDAHQPRRRATRSSFRASRTPRMYGRLVLLPQPAPGAARGVKLLMLATPDGGADKATRRRHPRRAQDAVPQLPLRDGGPMTSTSTSSSPSTCASARSSRSRTSRRRASRPGSYDRLRRGDRREALLRADHELRAGGARGPPDRRGRQLPAAADRPGALRGARAGRLRRGGPRDPARARHRRSARRADPLTPIRGIGSGTSPPPHPDHPTSIRPWPRTCNPALGADE